jgi:hypothetical protein
LSLRSFTVRERGKISAEVLIKIPKLVSVNIWSSVEILGTVDYKHDVPAVHYFGLLVNYQSGLYYLSQKLVEEIGKIDKRFLKIKDRIAVV